MEISSPELALLNSIPISRTFISHSTTIYVFGRKKGGYIPQPPFVVDVPFVALPFGFVTASRIGLDRGSLEETMRGIVSATAPVMNSPRVERETMSAWVERYLLHG